MSMQPSGSLNTIASRLPTGTVGSSGDSRTAIESGTSMRRTSAHPVVVVRPWKLPERGPWIVMWAGGWRSLSWAKAGAEASVSAARMVTGAFMASSLRHLRVWRGMIAPSVLRRKPASTGPLVAAPQQEHDDQDGDGYAEQPGQDVSDLAALAFRRLRLTCAHERTIRARITPSPGKPADAAFSDVRLMLHPTAATVAPGWYASPCSTPRSTRSFA